MSGRPWSLRTRLIALISVLALVAWAGSSALLYRSVQHEAGELFDAALVETAHAVLAAVGHEGLRKDDDDFDFEPEKHVHPERIFYQLRDRRGAIRYASPGAPGTPLATDTATGFSDASVEGTRFRVYTLREPRRGAAIHIAQRDEDRRDLVRGMAARLLLPGAAVVLLLAIGVAWVVRRVTAPVVAFSRMIDARSPTASGSVAAGELPAELQPVARAVNGLLERVEAALVKERTLTADAAHELRTPLAALRAQAQVALRSVDDGERRDALQALIGGVDRATRLVETVLELARLDARAPAQAPCAPTALRDLADRVATDFAGRTHGRQLDIDVPDFRVRADPDALLVALRNLCENALRHAATRVRVTAHRDGATTTIVVLDDGPGMPPEQRARAFDRFYRGTADGDGAGLGLALVKRVAELHGGEVRFIDGLDGRGLGVELTLRDGAAVKPG